MPLHKPIPEALIEKWSARIAKDLEKWANSEHQPGRLEWKIDPSHCGCEFVPPSQVTEKVVVSFIFHGQFKGKPDNKISDDAIPDRVEDSEYTIKKLSKRVLKKVKR